ncbi:MAG: sugar-binding protein [Armatimonadota bacterium]|nr:sugar-binding protein [Armatimonadota bacterium]
MRPLTAATLLALVAAGPAAAITIDGDMSDWDGAAAIEMPAEVAEAAETPFGVVERLWIAHDGRHLFFRIRFARERPFADETQDAWQDSYWANMRYIVLDVDGDSRADYYTNQIARPDGGLNHTYVVRYTEDGRETYLWYEGHPDWSDGPRGHYSADGREIEIRVPIEPLNISTEVIGVQVQMSIRDGIEGPNTWTNDRYPSANRFFLYDMAQGRAVEAQTPPGPPSVTMVRADQAPRLDGRLDDPVWEAAPVLRDFMLNRGNAPAQAQTQVRLTWDSQALYLAAVADEPNMDQLRTEAVEAESKRVWRDDVMEVFVDFHHDQRTFLHLGVTAAGAMAAQFGVVRGAAITTIDIEPDAQAAWRHAEEGWSIEAAVSWANIGVQPVAGEVWGLNVCRGRPGGGEYSSWAGVQGRFAQPEAFGDMLFPHETGLRVLSRGMAARAGNADGANTLRARLDEAAVRASVTVAAGGDESFTDSATADPGEVVELPYAVTGAEGEMVSFEMIAGGETIYQASVPVVETEFPRVWQTEDPVFAELFGEEGPGMGAEGVLMWGHELITYEIAPFCLKHAQPWTLEDTYRKAAARKLHYFDGGTMLGGDNFGARKYCARHDVTMIHMGSRRAHAEGKPTTEGGSAYLMDPDNQQVYLQRVRDYATEWGDHLWGVCTGDEVQDSDFQRGLALHYDDDPYPFMDEVDRKVREEFGYGTFGIPESLDDPNPFRWIAYRRWYNHRFADFQRRIYETVKSVDEDLLVIGPDPVAQVQPFDYSGYGRWCEIVTHQCYPRGPHEQDVAWITKTLRDLSGAATMPCVHVENYANSFRPDEVRELMSEVYRGGGEGFHLYMPDTAGGRTPHDMVLDRFGSWPRWRTVMGVLDHSRQIDRPSLPDSRAAILFSNDAYMAQFLGGRQGSDQYRWMFNLLGPYAGGWFTVISDNQIGRDEIDLSDFSVIYVPKTQYQRRGIVEALVTWVEGGGTLVVTEPAAFTWHLDGSRMDDLRARLFPSMSEPADRESVSPVPAGDAAPVFGQGAALQLADGDRALLTYEDGSVAAAIRPLGEGEVYGFGFDPMHQKALQSGAWQRFWRDLHAFFDEGVDLPIWRFTFPPVPEASIAAPPGRCLTNNYVVWDTNEMIPMADLAVEGRYSYSVPPDLGPDEGGAEDIPFSDGDLMDRRSAVEHEDEDYTAHLRAFAVGWKTIDPVMITMDLGAQYPLDRIWLLFNGQLPDTRVVGRVGDEWVELGAIQKRSVTDRTDFPAVTIDLDEAAPAVRHLRLEVGARDEGRRLIIPEIEIWAREER